MTEENQNSYLPLFRKYRPQSFKDVIGQEFTVRALENAIKLNKIANAYLFCGPRGTGKTSSARIFAKSLNCKEGPTVEPCQKCQSCLDVTNASGLDVIEIDAATNRGIDDAKELISKVQYAPMNGKYKIFIIDEVHMLSKEAFNALLKTFEEPPKNVIFILATTEPHKVIETIVSRCQRFDFRRITTDDIVKRLREISDKEKINITDEALYTIAKNVSGGMRDSLALLDQASILGIDKEITKETIESLIGKLTFDVLFELTNKILSGKIEEAVLDVEKIYEKGAEPRNFVENYIDFLRNIILASGSKNIENITELTLLSQKNIEEIKNNSLFKQESLVYLLDRVIEFYKEIKNSTNPYLWAELMIIDMASNKETKAPAIIKPVNNIETPVIQPKAEEKQQKTEYKPAEPKVETVSETKIEKTAEVPAEKPKTEQPSVQNEEIQPTQNKETQPVQNVEPTAPTSGNPAEIWANILNKVESIPAKFFYSGVGKLVSVNGTDIVLGFVNENALAQARSDNKYNPLSKAIKEILGEKGMIEFVTINENTKIINTKINVKVSQNQAPSQQPQQQYQRSNPIKSETFSERKSEPAKKEIEEKEETDTNGFTDNTNYTKVTQEMLEAYSGKIVE